MKVLGFAMYVCIVLFVLTAGLWFYQNSHYPKDVYFCTPTDEVEYYLDRGVGSQVEDCTLVYSTPMPWWSRFLRNYAPIPLILSFLGGIVAREKRSNLKTREALYAKYGI